MRRWVEGLQRSRSSNISLTADARDADERIDLEIIRDHTFATTPLLDGEGSMKLIPAIKEDEGWTWKSIRTRWRYYIPVMMWLPSYEWRVDLPKDLLAGLAVATMLIPQALSYATLAKLPPEYGLYTAWAPLLVYFVLGTSKQLSIGPDALGSLLVGLTLETVPKEEVIAVSHTLALIAGLVLFGLGFFRFGFLDNVLSRPLLCGFINALAVYIIIEQSDTFLGLPTVQVHGWEKIVTVLKEIRILAIRKSALTSLAIMISFRIARRVLPTNSKLGIFMRAVPDMMFVVLLFLGLSYFLNFESRGVRILGDISSGFPVPTVPKLNSISIFKNYLPSSIIIGILGFVESILVAKIYARKNGYLISPNRELVAFGAANIIGAFFQAYPTFGSLTRSAVAQMYGARSQVYALVVSLLLLLTMLVLGPLKLFYYLPKVAMSGIVLVAASSLFELEQLYFLFKIRAWPEVFLAVLTFALTFVLGVDTGILISLAISVFLVIRHSSLPHISILGRTPTGKFRDVTIFKDAKVLPGLMLVSIDEPLHFANIEQVKEMLIRIEKLGSYWAHPSMREKETVTHWNALIINCKGVPDMDAGAMQVLAEMVRDYSSRGTFVCFVKLRDEIKINLQRADIIKSAADPRVFTSMKEAVGRFVVDS